GTVRDVVATAERLLDVLDRAQVGRPFINVWAHEASVQAGSSRAARRRPRIIERGAGPLRIAVSTIRGRTRCDARPAFWSQPAVGRLRSVVLRRNSGFL